MSSNFIIHLVHPCEIKNGGCKEECKKKGNEALCGCKEGFEFEEDGETCKERRFFLPVLVPV